MTPQEQQMIDGLIGRIRNTPVQNKDSEAEQYIQQSLSGTPDALYVLVQTVLVQQYGLQQAQSQITELKQQNQTLQDQLQQAADHAKSTGGSFLSHIFGGGSQPSQPQQGSQNPPYQPVTAPSAGQAYPGGYPPPPPPPPVYATQAYPAPGGGMFGGGGGGFLQGAMQTAAGVAAGELVFQGMEDLFHGFGGGHGGYGQSFGGGGGETIINNYNDDDRAGGRDRDFSDRGGNDQGFYNPSDDASRNDSGNDIQAGSDIGNFGGNAFEDTSSNDLSLDDSSSSDSGFDDNSGGDDFSSSDNS